MPYTDRQISINNKKLEDIQKGNIKLSNLEATVQEVRDFLTNLRTRK